MTRDLVEKLLDREPPPPDERQGKLLPVQPRLLDVPTVNPKALSADRRRPAD